ncbi:hypothetical protein GCM10022406_21160 [Hymenobacter algoricola]|uniref:T9SS type A sorting domain-containing protein n=1 Tax=Hymenobacter algoricola TaxID=486267 RepID=A0ABP7N4E4_9BACT
MLLLLLLTSASAWAQTTPLTGSYTINSAQTTGGTNFASFTEAATALTTNGVSGPVTFTVTGGPFTEQLRLTTITGASAANRVTFDGGGRTIQFGSSTSAQRAVVTLDGADFVTLNNLVVDATVGGTSTATYGWGMQLVNNADNNVINACTVISNTVSTSTNFAGIVSSASTTSSTTAGAASSQNLTLTGNTITGGYYGITVIGATTAAPNPGIIVRNNTVREFYSYGIYGSYLSAPQLIGNDLARPTRAAITTFYGIYLTTGVSGAAIEKNRIHQAFTANNTATSTTYGLYMTTGTAATAAAPNEVINNLLYDLDGNGAVYGLYNGSSSNVRYYHNTVSIDDQTNTSASATYGLYQTTGLGVEFKNNIVQLSRAGTGTSYALYLSSATGTLASNFNDLSGSGTDFVTGYYTGTSFATLATWKTANNGAYDQNSVDAAPQFAAGSLRPTATPLNSAATPLTRVTDDFTGAARGATPDIGAYEFTPASDDVALVSIDSPVSPVTVGARTITVTILNNGATPLNSVRLVYTLNGNSVTQNFTLAGGLASGATRSLSFATLGTMVSGANTLTVTASLPNGNADTNAANNTLSTTLYTALAGTYTINKSQPTGGTNFTSFADAATTLNAAGITASLRLNVLNGPYTEQFVLGVIPGVSATDTIVIDGGTGKQELNYSGTTAQPAAVVLNGTDYVTLNNLTIDATAGVTAGIGILLVDQANNNRISNCVVRASLTSTSTTSAGIAASGSITSATTAGDANNVRIINNVVSGGYYGVILTGTSTTVRSTGVRVTGNEIRDFYLYGLDVENSSGARLIGNNVHRTNRAAVSTFYGIYLLGTQSAAVENNRIHDNATAVPTSTSAAYGIYTSGDATAGNENDIVNNLVYNFTGAGTEYGLYNTSADFVRYYHNTVSLDNTAATATAVSYGFYQVTSATGIELRNNLISVTRGGTGNRYALYFATAASTISSNSNDLYLGTGSNFFTGRYVTDFTTLAAWKAANNGAYDQNSLQTAPLFVNPASDLHPTSVLLNEAGTPATLTRVPLDFAGVSRSNPPDLGAYELVIVSNDVAVVSIDSPTTPAVLGNNVVAVTIRNGGTTVLTSVTLTHSLASGTPVSQLFSNLTLAPGATQQLTFTAPLVLTMSGTFTLTVTGSLPNGQADGNASNNSQTITFDQPTPPNDEPCAALVLTPAVLTASNGSSTTTRLPGIVLPACSPALSPKDVWFTATATGPSLTIYTSGAPAGMVRVFSSASCANGPFTPVFCAASGINNTNVGTVTVTGLTSGQQYYVAVSGNGSNDATGPFRISLSPIPLSSRPQLNAAALSVFPNPSAGGQFTLRLAQTLGGSGTAELVNTLGQTVLRQPLTSTLEQQVSTRGLAAGLYTLRVQAGPEIMTRKVVLE